MVYEKDGVMQHNPRKIRMYFCGQILTQSVVYGTSVHMENIFNKTWFKM